MLHYEIQIVSQPQRLRPETRLRCYCLKKFFPLHVDYHYNFFLNKSSLTEINDKLRSTADRDTSHTTLFLNKLTASIFRYFFFVHQSWDCWMSLSKPSPSSHRNSFSHIPARPTCFMNFFWAFRIPFFRWVFRQYILPANCSFFKRVNNLLTCSLYSISLHFSFLLNAF